MKSKNWTLYLSLLPVPLLLTGCMPNSDRFQEEPATLWDGLWHGVVAPVVAPVYWLTEDTRPRPTHSTPGYIGGVRIGMAWVYLWALGFGLLAFFWELREGEEIGFCFVMVAISNSLGLTIGVLLGGVICAITYLVGAIGTWLGWLVGVG